MTEQLGIACLAACAILAGFVLLQLVSERRRRGSAAWAATLIAAMLALTVGSTGDGIGWIGDAARRGDVIGLGITFSVAAVTIGVIAGGAHRTHWGQISCVAGAMLGVAGALAAVAIGRSTGHWEFVALVTCGAALTVIGALGARDRTASADRRIVVGAAAALGLFTTIGGTALGIAWSSLA